MMEILRRPKTRLFLTATSLLFVELLLIRWIPANVIYVGFFRNFLLMASFLGIGVGILWGRDPKRIPISPFGPLMLALVVLVTQFRVTIQLGDPNEIFFGLSESRGADINFLVLPALVMIATFIMAGLAVPLGRLLTSMPPLTAYTIDILGSMTGVVLFTVLSATGTPPLVWFGVVAVLASLMGLGTEIGRRSIVTAVSASEAALAALRQQPYELAFLDLRLGESNGLDLIPKLLTIDAGLPVIVMTAYATIDTAVDAIKRGAADYLPKPFTPQQIRHVVDQSIKQRDLKTRLLDLEGRLREATPAIDLETDSPKVRQVLEVAAKAAVSDVPVLLRGESGTGKELVAAALHAASPRASASFVRVNSAAIPRELIESEMFGHEKGAFTGAHQMRRGKLEVADKGTLFLDEVGDMSLRTQAKVLRVLQEGEVERIGSQKTIQVDVRVLAATNKDLEQAIENTPRKGAMRPPALKRQADLLFHHDGLHNSAHPAHARSAQLTHPGSAGQEIHGLTRSSAGSRRPLAAGFTPAETYRPAPSTAIWRHGGSTSHRRRATCRIRGQEAWTRFAAGAPDHPSPFRAAARNVRADCRSPHRPRSEACARASEMRLLQVIFPGRQRS
jgi:FixJ family two-component response regulator